MILAGNTDSQLLAYLEWTEVEHIGLGGPFGLERGEKVVSAGRAGKIKLGERACPLRAGSEKPTGFWPTVRPSGFGRVIQPEPQSPVEPRTRKLCFVGLPIHLAKQTI